MYQVNAGDSCFQTASDAKTIQNAIAAAKQKGNATVRIPSVNPRTGRSVWIIDESILLPSHITIEIENTVLRMADHVIAHTFVNENAWDLSKKTAADEQEDIHIIGIGEAVLDGGEPNGTSEQLHREHPEEYPNMFHNLPVFLHNVRNFEIRNLHFKDTRYWSLCFMYCRNGIIRDIDVRNYATVENQDGIDLRIGCHDIRIENLIGITGDDTLAMTALPDEEMEKILAVPDKSPDIHHIDIRNIVCATHGCGIVRFLCEDGAQEYDITIDGITDTGKAISGEAVLFGTKDPYLCHHGARKMGDLRDITIRHIVTDAQKSISFTEACQNVLIEDVEVNGRCELGIKFNTNFEADNVVIKDLRIAPTDGRCVGAFGVYCPEGVMKNVKMENVYIADVPYIFCGEEFPIANLRYERLEKGIFTAERPELPSAYMRYFETIYGEVLERPKDNRFDGTLTEEKR